MPPSSCTEWEFPYSQTLQGTPHCLLPTLSLQLVEGGRWLNGLAPTPLRDDIVLCTVVTAEPESVSGSGWVWRQQESFLTGS